MADGSGGWTVIVHGGAKRIEASLIARNRDGCLKAAEAGGEVLRQGGTALLAVERAVLALEDDPVFNAGFGSVLNEDGDVEMDAAIMEGTTLRIGAVAGVRRLRNPVSTARAMLDELPVLLAGEGAERFALERGIALCAPGEMISSERLASEYTKGHDTVGAVAIDAAGHFAAATSTGGLPGKHPGRIGDSPIPGCGYYADDTLGAAAFSGDGESILRTMLAARVMQGLEEGPAAAAAQAAIEALSRVGGEAGVIVLDRHGHPAIAHNSDHFAVGVHASGLGAPRAATHARELEDILHG
jgi:L-asparaginase / beta-aspartyl-peptidase